jgi:transposase
MLGQRSPQRGMFDIDFLYQDRIPVKSFYGFLARYREKLFVDEDFASLYVVDNGRPSVPPSILAIALLLQCHDKASDQEACERAQYDLRWAHALGIPPASAPFAKSTLQLFRAKLIISGKIDLVFRRSLDLAKQEGFLGGRKLKVAVDTTPIFGAAAVKDTYNLLADGIRCVIRAVVEELPIYADEWAEEHGFARYFAGSIKGQSDVDWNDKASRQQFLAGIVDDAVDLLKITRSLPEAERNDRLAKAEAVLKDLVHQDVECDATGPILRQGVAPDRIVSAQDPDMRHGRKSASKRFDGFKGAIAVEPDTGLITAVDVVDAGTHDGDTGLPLTEQTERNTGLEVEETIGDTAYGDATTREDFEAAKRRIIAKVPTPSRAGLIPKTDFTIDLAVGTCTCPAGHVTHDVKTAGFRMTRRGQRVPMRLFRFGDAICGACPLRQQCTRGAGGRTIQIHPREAEIQSARAFQRSAQFAPYKISRQRVEHRIARLRQLGAGKSRYIGKDKTRGQLIVATAVANLCLIMGVIGRGNSPHQVITVVKHGIAAFCRSIRIRFPHRLIPCLVPLTS